ncbi:uracil-DNA glycosylase [Sedimentibacter sp. zth1]|uniref:uracil-DNA glycosylase n=1 Tax=Sedimentibacter sp. zth1 TaxID=2816908 RepID=UPI001A91ACCA|nr:uracil-DNA glycosylase [Sedimentibacter sp. zth1]QSX06933.1 uracil-DNA glycosylase [Sedimentibacter sp. zth1]
MYTLDEVKKFCLKCNKCRLSEMRTNVVFGEGNANSVIMFVGEGPGYNEDLQGRPFVGKAGQLFEKMIKSINLTREDIYITNIVKCRPPKNRNPMDDEQELCIDYLRWQVKLINPKIIVCLGSVAAKKLIYSNKTITSMRGKWVDKGGILFTAIYHPSYLLRNESAKKDAWQDLKSISDKIKQIRAV